MRFQQAGRVLWNASVGMSSIPAMGFPELPGEGAFASGFKDGLQ